jgi:putative ABC transport system permease protein
MTKRHRSRFLLVRLGAQNVGRRLLRSLLLGMAVMIAVGVVFSGFVTGWSLRQGILTTFSRMGADLIVVPHGALVNITSTLLTVQPTDLDLDAALGDKLRAVPGVATVAAQRLIRASVEGRAINLIAYDQATDFTVESWLPAGEKPVAATGGLLVGERVALKIGEALTICGRSLVVTGRLGRTGVGPFDESYFITFSALDELVAAAIRARPANAPVHPPASSPSEGVDATHHDHAAGRAECLPPIVQDRVSAFLLQLSPGASAEQARFAIGQIPAIKIVTGNPIFTAARQSLGSLFGGVAIFAGLLMLAIFFLVSLLFSAIVQERYREIGVLRAIGARPAQIISITLIEAGLITGFGGLLGIGVGFSLIFVFARSLGFYFSSLGVPFDAPPAGIIWIAAGAAALCGVAIGVGGAFVAAWRTRRLEPYAMIQMESAR